MQSADSSCSISAEMVEQTNILGNALVYSLISTSSFVQPSSLKVKNVLLFFYRDLLKAGHHSLKCIITL